MGVDASGLTAGGEVTPSLRLVRPLGVGGMGSVWIAEHTGLKTQVVVKFMSDALAGKSAAVARFSREAAAASRVKSPHVVHMIDYGVSKGGKAFIAMELLDGHDLWHRLQAERAMPPRQVATVVSHVAKALTRAHERGVVHRDIKPHNIFLSDGGGGEAFVKVLDFGVAKIEDPHQLSLTDTGAPLGTPFYMSPEQILGSKTVDHRADLWSLGVVAFEALSGRRPFDGQTLGALLVAICNGPIPAPSTVDPSLPSGVDAWFARACDRDVGKRFATARELADALVDAVGGTDAVPFAPGSVARVAVAQPPTELAEPGPPGAHSSLGAVADVSPADPRKRRVLVAVAAVAAIAAVVGGAIFARSGRSPSLAASVSPPPLPPAPEPVASASPPAVVLVGSPTERELGESGWVLSGGGADLYTVQRDTQLGRPSWVLEPAHETFGKYGTWVRQVDAADYRGKRVQITASVRTQGATGRVDFWARMQAKDSSVDGDGLGGARQPLPPDSDWIQKEIVLDVPVKTDRIEYGVGVAGPGKVWLESAKVEALGGDVPLTGASATKKVSAPPDTKPKCRVVTWVDDTGDTHAKRVCE